MKDHSDGVMIALLPITTDWCRIEVPHLTLVYAGKASELKPTLFNEMAKDASSLAAISKPLTLRVTGKAVMGDEEKVDVLKLQLTSELVAMRHFLEHWNGSKQDGYIPHCTVGDVGVGSSYMETPNYLAFDKLMVVWGNDHRIDFNLKER